MRSKSMPRRGQDKTRHCGNRVGVASVFALGVMLALVAPALASTDPGLSGIQAPRSALSEQQQVRVSAPRTPGAPAPRHVADGAVEPLAGGRFVVLQMNLCNGGDAGCYAGGLAPSEAAVAIGRELPDLVTLNEICFNDVEQVLWPAMRDLWASDWTYYVFTPAMIKDTEDPYLCANGDWFGNAVMGHVPESKWQGVKEWGWRYGDQDGGREERTAACAYAIGDHLACATHLSARSEPVALKQCQALMFDIVPYMRSVEGAVGPTLVGGDFNLEYDTSDPENVQKCVPNGYTRKGDGDVQHIIFSNDLVHKGNFYVPLQYTDHIGFGVILDPR